MSNHTPTPYTYTTNTLYVLGQPDGMPNPVASPLGRTVEQCQANAAFIVRACNSHQAMVDACKTLLDAYNEQVTPTHMEWRAIEAALKLAGAA